MIREFYRIEELDELDNGVIIRGKSSNQIFLYKKNNGILWSMCTMDGTRIFTKNIYTAKTLLSHYKSVRIW